MLRESFLGSEVLLIARTKGRSDIDTPSGRRRVRPRRKPRLDPSRPRKTAKRRYRSSKPKPGNSKPKTPRDGNQTRERGGGRKARRSPPDPGRTRAASRSARAPRVSPCCAPPSRTSRPRTRRSARPRRARRPSPEASRACACPRPVPSRARRRCPSWRRRCSGASPPNVAPSAATAAHRDASSANVTNPAPLHRPVAASRVSGRRSPNRRRGARRRRRRRRTPPRTRSRRAGRYLTNASNPSPAWPCAGAFVAAVSTAAAFAGGARETGRRNPPAPPPEASASASASPFRSPSLSPLSRGA